ncbi:DUF1190 domain-containing protein [Vibrio sp. S9_S30]|uniref:DUF1190 domain-containing protein n=1 Tax=Vibrio sp. S9_S30 TaxID=2720226 RepID=UPI001680FE6F|nr:DUF1190 domain-containing protein [Vibrio sp. S9_S30]MBD1555886.1 DUF1190 domain-containing protein [Vibrio sp. S9_S30]
MKRSKRVILPSMKKDWQQADMKPLVAFIGLASITGCSDDSTEAQIFKTVGECSEANPGYYQQCQAAYKEAAEMAFLSSPRYTSQSDCEFDFSQGCVQPEYQNWFAPALGGFMFARLTNSGYYSRPLYTYRGGWYGSDGSWYGSSNGSYKKYKKVKIKSYDLNKQPAISRTMSRGGFGSTVEAKSSWSKSSGSKSSSRSSGKKSGWGG